MLRQITFLEQIAYVDRIATMFRRCNVKSPAGLILADDCFDALKKEFYPSLPSSMMRNGFVVLGLMIRRLHPEPVDPPATYPCANCAAETSNEPLCLCDDCQKSMNIVKGFRVCYEVKEGGTYSGKYYPSGDETIPTEELAWELAKTLASVRKESVVNVFVVKADKMPVKDFKARMFNKFGIRAIDIH